MSLKKLYIGCSLTQAPKLFISHIETLKSELKNDFQILDFIGLTGKTSEEVYEHDRKCVLESDLFLAVCDYPSIGLGMEIGFAIENNKRILIAYSKNNKITRMVLGIPKTSNIFFLEYSNTREIINFL